MIRELFGLICAVSISFMLVGVGYAYDCSSTAQYVDGSSYSTGAVVQNNGEAYQCTVGGWCTVGGPYAPGAGWAWTSAWSDLGVCAGGGNPPPSSGNPPPSSGNPPPSSGNPPPSSGNPPPSSGNPPPSSGGSCTAAAWDASTAYNGGAEVSYDGNLYSAKWWTQGDNPASHSGAWDVWNLEGACSGGGNPPPSSGNPPPSSGNPPPSSGNPPPSSGNPPPSSGNPPPSSGNPPPSSGNPPPSSGNGTGSVPKHVLVGYWHNFDNGSGFIPLSQVLPRWDVVEVSFAVPTISTTDGTIGFTPYDATDQEFIQEVDYLHSLGMKVLISIGGAKGEVKLETAQARENFVNSMIHIIEKFHFDGMDIDFEGHSISLNQGDDDFKNPTTPVIVNTIEAIRAIHDHFGSDFMVTMAPQTFFVQLGYQFYGGTCLGCDRRAGSWLPIIYGLRDILSWVQVQDYNSGPITGLDDQYHTMGNADFHVAMLDMLLNGFTVADTGETFPPLRPDQVVLGVPASVHAGGGYVAPAGLKKALNYIIRGQQFGSYQMRSNPANNGSFRGVMTWSINWDAFANQAFSTPMRAYLDGLP